jgi:ssDNA-binding Zn-finger/Zn-ribbon topoisomerase 1
MRLIDLKCPKCGKIYEDVSMKEFENNDFVCDCDGKTKLKKIIPSNKFRIIKYSPEYAGGNNKNLLNVHDDLGKRDEKYAK